MKTGSYLLRIGLWPRADLVCPHTEVEKADLFAKMLNRSLPSRREGMLMRFSDAGGGGRWWIKPTFWKAETGKILEGLF